MSSDPLSSALGPLFGAQLAQGGGATRLPDAGARIDDQQLREVAQKFEATFLAEMLKHAGFEDPGVGFGGEFGGGYGEDAFKSMLVREYADDLSRQGRLGLAEHIYADLKQRVAPNAY